MVAARHAARLLVRQFVLMLDLRIVVAHLRFSFLWLRHAWRLHSVSGFRCPLHTRQRNLSAPEKVDRLGAWEGAQSVPRRRPARSDLKPNRCERPRRSPRPRRRSVRRRPSSRERCQLPSSSSASSSSPWLNPESPEISLRRSPSAPQPPPRPALPAFDSEEVNKESTNPPPLTQILEETAFGLLVCNQYANRPSTPRRPPYACLNSP